MMEKNFASPHNLALSQLLVSSRDGTNTATATALDILHATEAEPVQESEFILDGRQALLQAAKGSNELVYFGPEYLEYCGVSLNDGGRGKDEGLNQRFVAIATEEKPEEPIQHPNVQRIYGFSDSLIILEDLPKGTVAELLITKHGRLQLNAPRRIQIMLNVAKVMDLLKDDLQKLHVSSYHVGLTLDLTPKLFQGGSSDGDHVHEFGILMIELLTGCLNNDQSEDRKLGDFVERYRKGSGHIIEDDLDPYVRESWTFNILSQLIELALGCVNADEAKRPSTEKLVETLGLISTRMQVVTSFSDFY
jgi:hypothetical protein